MKVTKSAFKTGGASADISRPKYTDLRYPNASFDSDMDYVKIHSLITLHLSAHSKVMVDLGGKLSSI